MLALDSQNEFLMRSCMIASATLLHDLVLVMRTIKQHGDAGAAQHYICRI